MCLNFDSVDYVDFWGSTLFATTDEDGLNGGHSETKTITDMSNSRVLMCLNVLSCSYIPTKSKSGFLFAIQISRTSITQDHAAIDSRLTALGKVTCTPSVLWNMMAYLFDGLSRQCYCRTTFPADKRG